jgi:hypothetical protein
VCRFVEKYGEGDAEEVMRNAPREAVYEKGQSKRIWGELYKVMDSSDVIIQVHPPSGVIVQVHMPSGVIMKVHVPSDVIMKVRMPSEVSGAGQRYTCLQMTLLSHAC